MTQPNLDRRASLSDVQRWLDAGVLRPSETLRARGLLGDGPTLGSAWRFVARRLVWIGCLLLAAALVFFIASQWGKLGLYGRLLLTLGVTVASTAAAAWFRTDTLAGQASTALAALSFGPVMAVYGQTFQTGESWDLFGRWFLVAAAFAWAARSAVCQVLAVFLGWLTFVLVWPDLPFATRHFGTDDSWPAGLFLVAVAAGLVAVGRRAGLDRWSVRAAVALALGSMTVSALDGILDGDLVGGDPLDSWIAGVLGFAVAVAVIRWFQRDAGDAVLVMSGLLALGGLLGSLWGRFLLEIFDEEAAFLALGIGVCALSGLGTWWFRRWHSARDEAEVAS